MIRISSTIHNYSISVSKVNLLELFPESMLSKALELDKSATEIPISNTYVTNIILEILEYMIDKKELPPTFLLEDRKELPEVNCIKSAGYLNIDILEVLSSPNIYKFIMSYPTINLVDTRSLAKLSNYKSIMSYALKHLDLYILKYLFQVILNLWI